MNNAEKLDAMQHIQALLMLSDQCSHEQLSIAHFSAISTALLIQTQIAAIKQMNATSIIKIHSFIENTLIHMNDVCIEFVAMMMDIHNLSPEVQEEAMKSSVKLLQRLLVGD